MSNEHRQLCVGDSDITFFSDTRTFEGTMEDELT